MRFRQLATLPVTIAEALALPGAALESAAPAQFGPTGQQVYTVPSGVLLDGVVAVGGWVEYRPAAPRHPGDLRRGRDS